MHIIYILINDFSYTAQNDLKENKVLGRYACWRIVLMNDAQLYRRVGLFESKTALIWQKNYIGGGGKCG